MLTKWALLGILDECVKRKQVGLCRLSWRHGWPAPWESAMLVNVSEILSSEGKTANRTAALEMTSFQSGLGDFPIKEKSPVELVFANTGKGKASVKGSAVLVFETRCDRCLRSVDTRLELVFDREITAPDAEPSPEADPEEERFFMEGFQFDVEAFVYHEILLGWPMKILCRQDCKGICMKCGKDLNEGECGCDTFVPDPRMAAIKDIFERNKEV